VIEKMFIEAEVDGDPFEVSDAETMLSYINPEAIQKESITIFSKPDCPFCKKAKALLNSKGLKFDTLDVGDDVSMSTLKAVSDSVTVPQIFIDGQLIGGSEELAKLYSQ
jgi:glutaredoxin-like protein